MRFLFHHRQGSKSLVGQRFGKLVVEKYEGTDKFRNSLWFCKCDCGKEFFTTKQHITQNISKNRIITCNECAKKRQKSIASKFGKINEIYLRQTAKKFKIEQSRVDKLCRVKKYKKNKSQQICLKKHRKAKQL